MLDTDDAIKNQDDIKVNKLTILAVILGPKFIFPSRHGDADDKIGLYIATQQTPNIHDFQHRHDLKECNKEAALVLVTLCPYKFKQQCKRLHSINPT